MGNSGFFVFKLIFSGFIIAFSSWLAGRKPVLAGFIIALPMMSILSILFSYLEYRDMKKIDEFAMSIITAVPLSLTFFLPFILNKWLKMNFLMTYSLAFLFLAAGYFAHQWIFKTNFLR